jgi:hypothetical protein
MESTHNHATSFSGWFQLVDFRQAALGEAAGDFEYARARDREVSPEWGVGGVAAWLTIVAWQVMRSRKVDSSRLNHL